MKFEGNLSGKLYKRKSTGEFVMEASYRNADINLTCRYTGSTKEEAREKFHNRFTIDLMEEIELSKKNKKNDTRSMDDE